MKKFTAKQIAKQIDAKLIGNENTELVGINSLDNAISGQISFVDSDKYLSKIPASQASAFIVGKEIQTDTKLLFVVKNVNKALINVLNMFADLPKIKAGIHPTVIVEDGAKIDPSASISSYCHIESGAVIGKECVIGSFVKIGQNSVIGDRTNIHNNVIVHHNCKIGKNCLLQSGSVIGSVGFGYSFFECQHQLIPHIGGVIIEDCVDIGANTCVDRAKFGNTIIGAGTKIDNLVQIAHNAIIGKCCLLAGQAGIAGSVKLGNGVVLGGRSGVADHLELSDGTMVGGVSCVLNKVAGSLKLAGIPAVDMNQQLRQTVLIQRLPEMVKELKELKEKVKQFETSKNN